MMTGLGELHLAQADGTLPTTLAAGSTEMGRVTACIDDGMASGAVFNLGATALTRIS